MTLVGKYRCRVIYPDKVDAGWWRKEGHALYLVDIKEALAQNPEVLVVGTGTYRPRKRTPKRCDFFGHEEIHDEEKL